MDFNRLLATILESQWQVLDDKNIAMKCGDIKRLYWGVLGLFVAGCGPTLYTEYEREESFRPHQSHQVGGISIRDHVGKRTGILFDGIKFPHTNSRATTTLAKEGTFSITKDWSLGTATAIDQRGYFVTAAHSVDGDDISLAFFSETGPGFEKARVVWMGDPDTGFDFALIHVPTALEYTFEWEQEIRRGEVVLSAGVNLNPVIGKKNEKDMDIGIDPVGGRITKTLGRKVGQGQQWLILHDCPVIKGYSGGPLLTRDGKLLGINFAGRSRSPIRWNSRMSHANAVRPDLDWLTRLIEQDQENISQ